MVLSISNRRFNFNFPRPCSSHILWTSRKEIDFILSQFLKIVVGWVVGNRLLCSTIRVKFVKSTHVSEQRT